MVAMLTNANPQVIDPQILRGYGLHDRRPPCSTLDVHAEQFPDIRDSPGGLRTVSLVDNEDVGNFHDTGLDRLHCVSEAWSNHDNGCVSRLCYFELRLPNTHSFDEQHVDSRSIEKGHRILGGQGEPPKVSPRAHTSDENTVVCGVAHHPDSVTQDCTSRERTVGVDGHDCHALT